MDNNTKPLAKNSFYNNIGLNNKNKDKNEDINKVGDKNKDINSKKK